MHKSKELPTYNAEISAGSLMIRESRVIAKLLLEGADEKKWYEAIFVKNLLQKKSPSTARRQTTLLKKRLELMPPEVWKMVVAGTKEVAIQALLAAAIKHSHLLGDFMDKVVRQHRKSFNDQLSNRDWEHFFNECEHRDPSVSRWSESTRKKLGQVVFRILAEAKYIDNTRSLKLIPVSVFPEVNSLLRGAKEDYVLRCMEVSK
jgi:hypothetical protein